MDKKKRNIKPKPDIQPQVYYVYQVGQKTVTLPISPGTFAMLVYFFLFLNYGITERSKFNHWKCVLVVKSNKVKYK